jgi:hypothetical protein
MKLMARYGRTIRYFSLLTVALILPLSAKQRHAKNQPAAPQDQIEVVAHLPLTDGEITRFLTTQHYRRDYLYAEHEPGKAITLIDVTNVNQPSVLADVSYPANESARLVSVTGNAALTVDSDGATAVPPKPQTFRIMSFADPLHPTVKQEFTGVTAMARDEKRGLIFLANAQGVWILHQQFAMDPEYVKEWEHMMLDAR